MKKRKLFLTMLTLLILVSSFALGAIEYNILLPDGRVATETEADIIGIVEGALDLEAAAYYKANVKPVYDGELDALVVYLLRSDVYLAECYKIDVDANLDVVTVVDDYVEVEEAVRDEECRACPDTDIEMLFTTSETTIGEAKKGVERAYNIALGKGYKAKMIIDRYEVTAETIKNYLTCPNLKLYGRIGHGMKDRILFADGTVITSSWLSQQSSDFLKGKVIYLNSCQVHNSPWEPAIMSIGTYAFVGGNVDLGIGTSEYVFTCWLDKVFNGAEMKQTVTDCEIEQNYPRGDHGFSGTKEVTAWYYPPTGGETPTPTMTMTPTPTPTAMYINVAVNKPVTASGEYSNAFPKEAAVDDNTATVWGSKYNAKSNWIFVNLGQKYDVDHVVVKFFDPYYATHYYAGVSDNGAQWNLVNEVTDGNGGDDIVTINNSAQYVGILLSQLPKKAAGIKELQVIVKKMPPTPIPTMTPENTPTPTDPPGTAWQAGVYYDLGAEVTYNGKTWICQLAHTSNEAWYPGAPNIWFWEEK